jgi:DNA polymerase III gamma/tau subunit
VQMAQDPKLLVDVPGETVRRMESQAQRMDAAKTLHAIKRFSEAATQLKGSYQPQLPLELALIEAAQGPPAPVQAAASQQASAPAQTPARSQPKAQAAPPKAAAQTEDTSTDTSSAPARGEPAQLDHEGAKKLSEQWRRLLDQVRDRCGHNVRAALNSVRASAVSTHAVALAFGNNEFSRDMVAKPETLKQVTQILSEFLGRPVTVECQMGETAHLSNTRDTAAPAGGETDSLVEYAVNELGAEVVK